MKKQQKDLSNFEKSFAYWLSENYDYLMTLDRQVMRDYIESNMDDMSMSDNYRYKFFRNFDNTRNHFDLLSFITNTYLNGSGLGVISNER